jgi:hypothetical protein
LLVPLESADRLAEVALPSGTVIASTPVGRQPHDAAAASGAIFVGDELANTVHIVRPGGTTHVVAGPLQPGGVAASTDGSVVVVGVRGRLLTAYRADGTALGSTRCGAGPTHVVAGSGGLYWVVDTNGGAVLPSGSAGRGHGRSHASPSAPDRTGLPSTAGVRSCG